jgi:SAM-dependent methyltransferase
VEHGEKEDLSLDVEALRRKLGPAKVSLIEQWIREVNGPLDAILARYVNATSFVLDAGCSRGDPDLPSLQRAKLWIGCDTDILGLRANRLAHARLHAALQHLPLKDAAVDVVLCKWVLEHLEVPEKEFREIARVLRDGGVFVALTPNGYSLFTAISRTIPYSLKRWLKQWMFGVHEEDTFPTYYRANTVRRLRRLAGKAGLERCHLQRLPGMWTFFIFSPLLARLVRKLEHWMSHLPGLQRCNTYLLIVWQKPLRSTEKS